MDDSAIAAIVQACKVTGTAVEFSERHRPAEATKWLARLVLADRQRFGCRRLPGRVTRVALDALVTICNARANGAVSMIVAVFS